MPLAGVVVILRNESTRAEVRTTTAKNGSYRFTGLEAGEYTLEADSPQLGRGRLQGIVIYAGRQSRVQAAMSFRPPAPVSPVSAPLQAVHKAVPGPAFGLPSPNSQLASNFPPTSSRARSPHTVTPLPTAALPAQPLSALSLPAQPIPVEEPAFALHSVPVENAAVSPLPIQSLPLTGMQRPVWTPTTAETTPPAEPNQRSPALPSASSSPGRAVRRPVPAAAPRQLAALHPTAAPEPALAVPLQQVPGTAAGAEASLAASIAVGRSASSAIVYIPSHRTVIEAAARQLNPVASAVVTTVAAVQLQALPVSSRRWVELALDSPTAAAAPGSSQVALRGAAQEQAETTIDGAQTRLGFGVAAGSPSSSRGQGRSGDYQAGQTWKGGSGFAIGESAIHQVLIVPGNVAANGAFAAGGLTDVETESGGNPLHGHSFLFDRQNIWGAQNPFTQWIQNTGSAAAPVFTSKAYTPPDHQTSWGIGLGNRLLHNRLSWFASLDHYQRNDPGLAMVKHPVQFFAQPSNDQLQLLSAQLALPSANPVGEALAAYWPMLETLAGLLGPAPRTSTQRTAFGRIDWKLDDRHAITIEGNSASRNSPGGGFSRVSEDFGNHSFGARQASRQWLMARWQAFLTPNLLAVSQFSGGRAIFTARPGTPSPFEQQFLNGNPQLPQIAVDSRYGFTIGNPSWFGPGSYPDEHLYHAQELLDWVHGPLLLKAGFELDHNSDATSLLRNRAGTFHYTTVENFISDVLAFQNFGADPSTARNPHNCDPTGKAWRDSAGHLRGLGALPCYSYFSQVIGPTSWHLSTNDWAGFVSTQWQPSKIAVFSFGLRWEREQMPPPIPALANPELPLAGKLPSLGNNWGPRIGLALGPSLGHWPVLRLGYGVYYARTQNATLQTALTQTGSLNGDLSIFIRPTDGYTSINGTSAAPFFPNELQGPPGSVVKPGVVEFAPRFRNPEVHQAVVSVEDVLPGRVRIMASALLSLGRHLPVAIDTNIDPAVNPQPIHYAVVDRTGSGPIRAQQITVPFYANWPYVDCAGSQHVDPVTGTCGRLNPNYQQITQVMSRANSTYEAAMLEVTHYGRRGLGFNASYTYAHAMDWNPNETTLVSGSDVLDPENFNLEYGTSNLDIRHSVTAMLIYRPPWKLREMAGRVGNGWMISGIGHFHSGMPYSMRVSESIPKQIDQAGNPIVGLGPGINGSGGDSRVYWLDNGNGIHTIGRNTFRYPYTWTADLRLGKSFSLGPMRRLQLLADSFNLFNHQNVTWLESSGYSLESGNLSSFPALCYLTVNVTTGGAACGTSTLPPGSPPPIAAFGKPLSINGLNFFRERQIELGLRMTF